MRIAWPVRAVLFLLALTAASAALAAEVPAIQWSLKPLEASAAPGETVRVTASAVIPNGWHTYSTKMIDDGPLATTFKAAPEDLVKIDGAIVIQPEPEKTFDSDFKKEIEILHGRAEFTVPLKIAASAKPGTYNITLTVVSEICRPGECIPPKKAPLTFKLTVPESKTAAPPPDEAKTAETAKSLSETKTPEVKTSAAKTESAAPKQEAAPAVALSGDEAAIADAKRKGIFSFFLAAALAGAGALLTPCVFPMIPITVSFFTKRKQATRAASVRDAAIYAFGIILTFTIIGMTFALFFKATGIRAFATNGWVNLVIAGIFSVLAMNLFGVFEIPLPTEFLSKVDASASQGGGLLSVVLMAFVFSITSFTCTVPFVGAVLLSAAQGEWFMPMVGMLGFSAAFALPFFALALFPTMLKSLPKSGGWLNSVKVVMGFLELAAALKFFSTADIYWNSGARFLPRELFLGVWIALAVLATFYLLGLYQFSHDSKIEYVGGARITFAVVFLALAFWLFTGFTGGTFGDLEAFLPQKAAAAALVKNGSPAGSSEPKELAWLSDFDAGLAEAKRSNKPVFVDFTGYTCGNCRVMESTVFPNARIQDLLAGYVRVKLYTDDEKNQEASDRYVKLQEERFQSAALPFYVLLTPENQVIATHSFDRNVESFAAFLELGQPKKGGL
ncbi:MAG: thioredoxin family protein [Planctomycetes bacterium]|nr:thioredoxin family protein [Planctomycetota bacterium]